MSTAGPMGLFQLLHRAAGAIFKSFDCEEKANQFLAAAVSVAAVASKRSSAAKTAQRESTTILSETQLDDLSNEQKGVVEAVLSGHNVFLTGAITCARRVVESFPKANGRENGKS